MQERQFERFPGDLAGIPEVTGAEALFPFPLIYRYDEGISLHVTGGFRFNPDFHNLMIVPNHATRSKPSEKTAEKLRSSTFLVGEICRPVSRVRRFSALFHFWKPKRGDFVRTNAVISLFLQGALALSYDRMQIESP